MRFSFAHLMVFVLFFSCSNKNNLKVDVSSVDAPFSLQRFDIEFYTANEKTLQSVKNKYPYLFPALLTDSLALAKINDPQEQDLFKESQLVFKDISKVDNSLSWLFKHVKYYDSQFSSPDVVTILSNIDYDHRVIYADTLLLISLDAYLGKNHPFYADFPAYIKQNTTKSHLIVDVANSIITKQVPKNTKRRFLDHIIYEGKKMKCLDFYLPEVTDHEKIGYSSDKLTWAVENEESVWMYFMDKNILFSTEQKLRQRFIENAPFSKFYTTEDSLSPGKIGVWLGWQIVTSYMKHNDVSLQELLEKDTDEIFKNSKYKPKK